MKVHIHKNSLVVEAYQNNQLILYVEQTNFNSDTEHDYMFIGINCYNCIYTWKDQRIFEGGEFWPG